MSNSAKLLEFKSVCWNFWASGHGKGSADGVGAACKRLADDAICRGKVEFKVILNITKDKGEKSLAISAPRETRQVVLKYLVAAVEAWQNSAGPIRPDFYSVCM